MAEFRKSVYGEQVFTTDVSNQTNQSSPSATPKKPISKLTILVIVIAALAIPVLIYLLIESNPNPNYPSQEEILKVTPPNP